MNGSSRNRIPTIAASIVTLSLLASACTSTLAPVTTETDVLKTPSLPSPSTPTLQASADIVAVSVSKPTVEAQDIFGKCHIGDDDLVPFKYVTGMGKIESARDLLHYVPLTGREPQLAESGPAWIVTVHRNLPQPGSNESWADPTCVVTDQEFGWFATGPVTNTATGKVIEPEAPIQLPDRSIPPLAP